MTKMKVKIMFNNFVVLTRMFVVKMSLLYMRSTRSSLLVSRHCCLLRSAVMVPEFIDPVFAKTGSINSGAVPIHPSFLVMMHKK